MKNGIRFVSCRMAIILSLLVAFSASSAFAHCDTVDGPVVQDALAALQKGDVTPVLKWVRKQDEKQVKAAFAKALAARKADEARKEKEEHRFFELLVKVHRASEGAPYTGVKPAGSVDPAIAAADRALASGDASELVKIVTETVKKGLHERFTKAAASRAQADSSVEAGRHFVRDYVEYTHYVEGLVKGAEAGHGAGHGHDAHKKASDGHGHDKHKKVKSKHDH